MHKQAESPANAVTDQQQQRVLTILHLLNVLIQDAYAP